MKPKKPKKSANQIENEETPKSEDSDGKKNRKSRIKKIIIGTSLAILFLGVIVSWASQRYERNYGHGHLWADLDHDRGGDRHMWKRGDKYGSKRHAARWGRGGSMGQMMDSADTDNDEKISQSEFLTFVQAEMAKQIAEAATRHEQMFNFLDKNEDGQLEKSELSRSSLRDRMWKKNNSGQSKNYDDKNYVDSDDESDDDSDEDDNNDTDDN